MSIIGVTLGYKDNRQDNLNIHDSYLSVIKEAGGFPVLLSPHLEVEGLQKILKKIDGVLLTGGSDVNPYYYNEEPKPGLRRIDPGRDLFELTFLDLAIRNKIPVLALCRGLQVLNIYCGGTIIQDMETVLKHDQDAPREFASHKIKLTEGGYLEKIYDNSEISVNSFHHQAIDSLGDDLIVEGVASDGTIEALVLKSHPFAIGVQWHPERMYESNPEQLKLFDEFIKVCK